MITLRPINLADPHEVTAAMLNRLETSQINNGNFRQMFEGMFKSVEEYMDWLRLRQKQNPVYASFAMLDGQAIGQLEMFENDMRRGTGYINHVFIGAAHRGTGMGRKLLKVAEDQLRADGFPLVSLSSIRTNEKTYKFYSACGWTCLGGRPDKPDTTYLWEKKLNNA